MKISKKDSKPNGRTEIQKEAECNKTSLGKILTSTGVVTHEQLQKALQYQIDNQDEMLGEILIKLDFITEEEYETARMKQRVLENGFDKKEMRVCFSMAKKRTAAMQQANVDLREAALQLVRKLKVEEG